MNCQTCNNPTPNDPRICDACESVADTYPVNATPENSPEMAIFNEAWNGNLNLSEHLKHRGAAYMVFQLGAQSGKDSQARYRESLNAILNWWRCDGDMSRLGELMDAAEGILEA